MLFIFEEFLIISVCLNSLLSLFITSCKFFDSFKNNLLSYSLYIFSKESHKLYALLYFSKSTEEKKICEKVFLISLTNSFND